MKELLAVAEVPPEIVASNASKAVDWATEFRAWCETRVATLDKLAAEIGVDRHTLRGWRTGRRLPREAQREKLYSITQLNCFSSDVFNRILAAAPKKRNSNSGTSASSSHASFAQEFGSWFNAQNAYRSQLALARALEVSPVTVRNWFAGREFPRDACCERLYQVTKLECFGANRSVARSEHERMIPAAIKMERRSKYKKNAELFRTRSRESWRTSYEAQRQFVTDDELAALRLDPRKSKNVCRECGENLLDVGPHLWPSHEMTVEEYKAKYGFNRSRNATRSESTNERQSAAMKRIRHQPPKWTRKHLPRAQENSLTTNVPGSARLEERLNARGKRLGARPQHWKRTVAGDVVTDARIAQLRLRGKTVEEIGTSLGMWPAPVWNRLERMGFPRRARVFVHGEPVRAEHMLTIMSDFDLSLEQVSQRVGYSTDWAKRLVRQRSTGALSARLAKRILKVREELTRDFRKQPAAGRQGGRPRRLTPSEELELPEKYSALRLDLKSLRSWIREQASLLSTADIWDRLCVQFRSGALRSLQFREQFFSWIEKEYDAASFRQGVWIPKDLAVGFLAADYSASESVIVHVLSHLPK